MTPSPFAHPPTPESEGGGPRFGITILPEHRWADAAPMWREAEAMGFGHAWTYDHLVWSGLQGAPWFAAAPTLAAAAGVTERIGLGTFVSSPNYRHPYVAYRDIISLDDITGGRYLAGLGTGGQLDAGILGDDLPLKTRVDRFHEFVRVLDRLMREDRVDHDGQHYRTVAARTAPGPTQRPRTPFVIAANGPRSIRLAVELGDGWVTTGPRAETEEEWWEGLKSLTERVDRALAAAGRTHIDRYLNLDSGPAFALESVTRWEDMVGRASALGFTDLITHWPRPDGPYAGSEATLAEVASRSLRQ